MHNRSASLSRLAVCFFASIFAVIASTPATARADHDMSGEWLVLLTESGNAQVYHSRWNVVVTGSDLSVTVNSSTYPGTIDTDTGEFDITFPPHACGPNGVHGSVAADGRTFEGLEVLHYFANGCVSSEISLDGSRCGNQEIDPGEACDDGNVEDGDCCSSSCLADDVGTACTTDQNLCTDDVCDGAGTCNHAFNTAPCADAQGCGTGACSAGGCQFTNPEPAGTACTADTNACTSDTCDGAGSCKHTTLPEGTDCDTDGYDCTSATCDSHATCIVDNVTACAPCGYCVGSEGCVRDPDDACNLEPSSIGIDLQLGEPDRQRLSIRYKDQVLPPDFGDPTASTSYTVCLYANELQWRDKVLGWLEIPAGGTCEAEACWADGSHGFKYRDESLANDGIEQVRLTDFKGFLIKGRGAGLGLPAALSPETNSVYPKIIADDGVTRHCWVHDTTPRRNAGDRFKGIYKK